MTATGAVLLTLAALAVLAAAACAAAALAFPAGARAERARLVQIMAASPDLELQLAGHHLARALLAEAPTVRIARQPSRRPPSTQPTREATA